MMESRDSPDIWPIDCCDNKKHVDSLVEVGFPTSSCSHCAWQIDNFPPAWTFSKEKTTFGTTPQVFTSSQTGLLRLIAVLLRRLECRVIRLRGKPHTTYEAALQRLNTNTTRNATFMTNKLNYSVMSGIRVVISHRRRQQQGENWR